MEPEKRSVAGAPQRPAWWLRLLQSNRLTRWLAYWWAARGETTILSGVGAGLKIDIGNSDPAYAWGSNELPVQQALAELLQPGHVFYDIGANIGFFTLIGARLVGPNGRVFAFEPVPVNAASVRKNIAGNHFEHCTLIEAAVTRKPGKGELLVAHYSGGSALPEAGAPPDLKETIPVDLVAIDDLVARQQIAPPHLVKIDVEGAEADVLSGMAQTLRQRRPFVIYEIDDGDAQAYQRKQATCEALLREHGYTITQLENSYSETGWMVGNYLAIPAERQ